VAEHTNYLNTQPMLSYAILHYIMQNKAHFSLQYFDTLCREKVGKAQASVLCHTGASFYQTFQYNTFKNAVNPFSAMNGTVMLQWKRMLAL